MLFFVWPLAQELRRFVGSAMAPRKEQPPRAVSAAAQGPAASVSSPAREMSSPKAVKKRAPGSLVDPHARRARRGKPFQLSTE